MRILIYGDVADGDSVSIQAPVSPGAAPPGSTDFTAEVLIDDSTTGTTLLSEADGSAFLIQSIESGGDLTVQSFDVRFDDRNFIDTSNFAACYCESVGDIPDPGDDTGAPEDDGSSP
jgi:hypothetical protein